MIKISSNTSRVSVKLKNFGNLNLSPLMQEIAGDLEDITEQAFERERDPASGRPWARLKSSTLRSRKRRGKTGKKLQVTGRLVNSIVSGFSKNKAWIGTNVEYSGRLQRGTRNMTPRPFIGLSRIHVKKAKRKFEKYIKNKYNSA